MDDRNPAPLEDRPESEPPVDERRFSGCFGVPAMLAVAVVIAAATLTNSLIGVVYAIAGVLALFLAIGLAMTIAKRE
ncbi:MAG: hypothetical protein ACLQBB_11040 [Solirubrobacteraceae bacterium]